MSTVRPLTTASCAPALVRAAPFLTQRILIAHFTLCSALTVRPPFSTKPLAEFFRKSVWAYHFSSQNLPVARHLIDSHSSGSPVFVFVLGCFSDLYPVTLHHTCSSPAHVGLCTGLPGMFSQLISMAPSLTVSRPLLQWHPITEVPLTNLQLSIFLSCLIFLSLVLTAIKHTLYFNRCLCPTTEMLAS